MPTVSFKTSFGRIMDTMVILFLGFALIHCAIALHSRREPRTESALVAPPKPNTTTFRNPAPAPAEPESATSILSIGPKEIPSNPEVFHRFPAVKVRFLEAKMLNDFVLFSPFFRSGNFTPTQIDQIMEVFSKRETAWAELQVKLGSGEIDDSNPGQQLEREADLSKDNSLRNIMGSSAFAQFKEYRASIDTRTHPVGLRALITATYDGDHPLQPTQFENVVRASQETRAFGRRFDSSKPADYRALEEKIAEIMTPEQISDFQLVLDYRKLENAGKSAAARRK